MTIKRLAQVPGPFGLFCSKQPKADLVEALWDCLVLLEGNESQAHENVHAMSDRLNELLKANKENRRMTP